MLTCTRVRAHAGCYIIRSLPTLTRSESRRMDRVAMLETMAAMQEAHNAQVHPQWREGGYAYYRAVWVECAELLDHFGWKWWKRQRPDLDQVRLELVDIWHFGMSDLIRADLLNAGVIRILDISPETRPEPEALRLAVEDLARETLAARSFALEAFAGVMRSLPMTLDELFRFYVGKNVLNRFRQDHGYRAGTYVKIWDGREDNEHLVELLDGLERPETAVADLYGRLAARYPAHRDEDAQGTMPDFG